MLRSPRVGALVSLISLAGVVWWILRQDTPKLPSSPADLAVCAAAVLAYAVVTLSRGLRWDVILRHARIGHRTTDAYALTVVGYMGNVVLPARGGEVLRLLLMSARSLARRREVLGSIVTERLLDGSALFVLLGLLTVAGVAGSPLGAAPAIAGGVALLAALAAVGVYLRLRRAGRFAGFAGRVRPVARMGRVLLGRQGVALAAGTLVIWLMEAGVLALCAAALGLGIGIVESVFLVVLVSLSAMIPAGPGYVGTFDAALLFGLDALGVASGDAVGLLLLYRAVIFLPVTVAGILILVTRYGGLRSLRRGAAAVREEEDPLADDDLAGRRPAEVPAGQRA
jgi:uncharacterized membrane protein YbhN (UPF0104 family)